MKTIELNGEKYVKLSDVPKSIQKAPLKKGMKLKMVRTYSAWVWFWYVEKLEWTYCLLREATRVYKWAWAFTLSELATVGSSNHNDCKFAIPVDVVELTQAIEILDITQKAELNLKKIPVWKI